MKAKKLIALVLAVLTITMAFAPTTKKASAAYAPSNWEDWPSQSINNYSTTYTFAIQNVIKGQFYANTPSDFKVDGVFGNGTKADVHRFNQTHSISNNSYVNSATWKVMREDCLKRNPSTSYYEPTLDRYTDFYYVKEYEGDGKSGDWFRGMHFMGPVSWATNRDGSRSTWHNIMN